MTNFKKIFCLGIMALTLTAVGCVTETTEPTSYHVQGLPTAKPLKIEGMVVPTVTPPKSWHNGWGLW